MDVQGRSIHSMPHGVLQMIFSGLGPKELCCVTATCRLWYKLNKDTAANLVWKHLYASRWRAYIADASTSWQGLYGKKMLKLQSWAGKYQQDNLYGHKAEVKAVKLLPSHDLLVSGSADRTLRLWSLESGLPISTTASFSGVCRALAMDSCNLISGHSDNTIRMWSANCSDTSSAMFDLQQAPQVLRGHIGPVASLSLNETFLYSGSWDYSVRIWSREDWKCQGVMRYDDWVSCVAARGNHLLVSAGSEVLVHDTSTGQVVRKFQNLHEGGVSCLEGAHNGRMLFTGASDGLVLAHDLRMKDPSLVLYHHKSAVHSLAFEDPWLASSSSSGNIMLINTEPFGRATLSIPGMSKPLPPSTTMRQLQGPTPRVLTVDLADQWVACGSDTGPVRTWDFTGASEAALRAASAKASRGSRRGRRRSSTSAATTAHSSSSHHQNRHSPPHPAHSDLASSGNGSAHTQSNPAIDVASCNRGTSSSGDTVEQSIEGGVGGGGGGGHVGGNGSFGAGSPGSSNTNSNRIRGGRKGRGGVPGSSAEGLSPPASSPRDSRRRL